MVGPNGLEPLTSTVSRWRSSQLSYGPTDITILAYGLCTGILHLLLVSDDFPAFHHKADIFQQAHIR
jgi:hypothetical protein